MSTNFDYLIIQNLFSNLSSLSILELFELRKIQIFKLFLDRNCSAFKTYIFSYLFDAMTIFSNIMVGTKEIKSSIIKISIGLFFSVVIYYLFNFFNVLGKTEKINLFISVLLPIIFLVALNSLMIRKFNEK